MSTEYRAKVKQKVWVRSVCTDNSEPYRLAQLARAEFKRACVADRDPIHVASADVLADVFDDSEQLDYPVE